MAQGFEWRESPGEVSDGIVELFVCGPTESDGSHSSELSRGGGDADEAGRRLGGENRARQLPTCSVSAWICSTRVISLANSEIPPSTWIRREFYRPSTKRNNTASASTLASKVVAGQ